MDIFREGIISSLRSLHRHNTVAGTWWLWDDITWQIIALRLMNYLVTTTLYNIHGNGVQREIYSMDN